MASLKLLRSGGLQRLFSFIIRPLLLALFITLCFRGPSLFKSSPNSKRLHPEISKALVIASTKTSQISWLSQAAAASRWHLYTYVTNDPTARYTVPKNKGNEAMVYLTYIIDHYSALPDIVFFHHDHAQAWHQTFPSTYELAHLNPLTVRKQGYLSPRCLPGCENIIELSGNVGPIDDLKGTSRDVQIASVLHEFLVDANGKRMSVPEKIAAPCCAQFAVSREAILKHDLDWWVRLRRWLIETELDSRSSGRVLEYTWHLWFGKEPIFCPEEKQCLCEVFGVGECQREL